MSIVVTTPTGHVGSRVVRLLAQAGVRPTVLARDPARLDPELLPHLDVRVGDLEDAGFVTAATAGADVLFWVDPTDFTADDPDAKTERLGRIAAGSVRTNGIGHVVFQSSVGAEVRHGMGLIDGLARVEQVLEETGAAVLHLRCGYFFSNLLMDLDGLRRGLISTAQDVDLAIPWVDPRDIGDVVTARLLAAAHGHGWSGRQVEAVHGPRDLTFRDVARILGEATGHAIRVEQVDPAEVEKGLLAAGLSPTAALGIVGMSTGPSGGFVPEQPRTVLSTTPTELSGWAHAVLRPLLAPSVGDGGGA